MTRKPSHFAPENVYAAAKQRVIDRLQVYYERFTGLGARTRVTRSVLSLPWKGRALFGIGTIGCRVPS